MTVSKFNNYITTKMESDLSFVYMTCLLNVLYNLMKYHKIISKGLRIMACTRLTTMGDNSRTESELLFLYVTHLLNVLYNLIKYHDNISKGY